jgi:hypothetical protein
MGMQLRADVPPDDVKLLDEMWRQYEQRGLSVAVPRNSGPIDHVRREIAEEAIGMLLEAGIFPTLADGGDYLTLTRVLATERGLTVKDMETVCTTVLDEYLGNPEMSPEGKRAWRKEQRQAFAPRERSPDWPVIPLDHSIRLAMERERESRATLKTSPLKHG